MLVSVLLRWSVVDAQEWLKHCIGAGRVVWVDANELELLLGARMVARPLAVSVVEVVRCQR